MTSTRSRAVRACSAAAAAAACLVGLPAHGQTVFSASGATAAEVTPAIDAFRASLGTLNPNVVGSAGSGRREINWDGVPDNFASPNNFPGNFFNVNSPRGVVFTTPGTGFQVSADSMNPTSTPTQFGNIDPAYPGLFSPFSQERLFTPIGSNLLDVGFFVPGTSQAALTRGFGVVFSDVDLAATTSLSFFDASTSLLGTFFASVSPGNEGFSFLGIDFGTARVARVRIVNGTQVLAAGNVSQDLVVMDDFLFGEPILAAIPEPETYALLLGGLAFVAWAGRRRKAR
jgi:hypothetical protein